MVFGIFGAKQPKQEDNKTNEILDEFEKPDVHINKLLSIDDWSNILMIQNEYSENYINSIEKLEKVMESEKNEEIEEMIDQVMFLLPKFYCPYYTRPRCNAISLYLQEKSYKPFTIMPSKSLKDYVEMYTKDYEYNKEKEEIKSNNYKMFSLFIVSVMLLKIFV
tara:strand:- start:381 stop:872 length:492 start_codon:yes stop_codon:yes gene_type:complete